MALVKDSEITTDERSKAMLAEGYLIYFPPKSTPCTEALFFFLKDYHQIIDFFFFSTRLASRADDMAETAAKALLDIARSDEERNKYSQAIANSGHTQKKLAEFAEVNSRNLVTSTVDLFLWYLSAIIQESMKRRPNMLKSANETMTVEEIIDFKSKTELVNYLIDRKVSALSYGGMKQMEKYLLDRLNVETFQDDKDRQLMNIFVELRNIYVHNRGRVNRIFLARAPDHADFKFVLGKRYHVDFENFRRLSATCLKTAERLDQLIAEKFKVQRKRYSTWSAIKAGKKVSRAKRSSKISRN
ncbi:hypothetical protein ACVINZ_006429 [Mesorhizobium jarvisii]